MFDFLYYSLYHICRNKELLFAFMTFYSVILLSIIVHEFGHLISALLCKVKVNIFSIGFGSPYISKKKWNIEWRLTPFLLGGYTSLEGETKKTKRGFLNQRWIKKVFILVSGVLMNFLLACVCYLIMYKSIITGIQIDLTLIKCTFSKDITTAFMLLEKYNPNYILVNISVINLFCAITNILPLPALDGGIIWLSLFERFMSKRNFEVFMAKINKIGFWTLMILQVIIIYWFIVKK